ncbi:hypothetical protein [Phenylobacterium soli]|uniref:Argininosuccinate lyase n=1 Tax=Phenylobacterium soli TaxID=2170551 RepID=A0A328AG96_9CAUL|nr:hypothetical protein [Phenylobacterium soli]RAK51838.1 hypothetical protein DJ017_18655 [Phenylobacterium soli]
MSRPNSALLSGAAVLALALAVGACQSLPGSHAAQSRQPADPNRPTRTIDPRDTSATPAPPRTLPIPGTGSDPTAVAPPGALPDPYANPPR